MPFWRLYDHVVWVTKDREPAILDGMIEPMKQTIAETTKDLGVMVFAIGVMPDHVHVLAQIPPSLDVASAIGRWKGATSHAANEHRPQTAPRLVWQPGYGVLSVSQHGFDQVRDYVLNQRERHAKRELYGVMERSSDDSGS
jgi:REP element-mobilizing transposase RayT